MLEQFYLPVTNVFIKIVSAFAIFLIGLIIGKFAGMLVTSLLYELKIEEILEKIGVKLFISRTAGAMVSIAIYMGGLVVALNQLGIAQIFVIMVAVFFAVIAALAFILGLTDIIRNFIAGISLRKKFLSRKTIELPEVKGRIVEVCRTKIKIRTKEKDIVVVPYIVLD